MGSSTSKRPINKSYQAGVENPQVGVENPQAGVENPLDDHYTFRDNDYVGLQYELKSTDGIINAFQFIKIIQALRCAHDFGKHQKCEICNMFVGTKFRMIKIPKNMMVYIPLYRRIKIKKSQFSYNDNETITLPRDISPIINKYDDSVNHIQKIQPIIKTIFDFQKMYQNKKLKHPIINECNNYVTQYKVDIQDDIVTIQTFEELDKITMEANGMEANETETNGVEDKAKKDALLSDDSSDDDAEEKVEIEGASAPPM